MGHQFARAAAAASLIVVSAACGGGDGDADQPAVLDNARDLVAAAAPTAVTETTDAPTSTVLRADELPPPDPSRFEGANRVVNFLLDSDGHGVDVDVWGRRTFDNAPILVAEGLGFGDTAGYFDAPPEYSLVAVGSGAGPDGVALAEIFNAVDGEQITMVLVNDAGGEPMATHVFERGTEQAIRPPDRDTGLIVIDAPNFRAFSEELIAAVGSDAFIVGDGDGTCRPQRREAAGLAPEILGDTLSLEIEVTPGPVRLTLHPWFASATCASPSVVDIDLTVEPGGTMLVLVAWSGLATFDWRVLPIG